MSTATLNSTRYYNDVSNHTNSGLWVDFSIMTEEQLKHWLAQATKQENMDMNQINRCLDTLNNLKKDRMNLQSPNFKNLSYDEKIQFVKRQISEIRGGSDIAVKAKEEELFGLLEQLQQEKDNSHNILTDMPSLKEYVSIKRRRTVNILKQVEKLEQEPGYPKNVLIYAMWITSSRYFGVGQSLKRWVARVKRNRKSDDIKSNIENLITLCQPEAGDSNRRKAIKESLLTAVRRAKDNYIHSLQLQNTF